MTWRGSDEGLLVLSLSAIPAITAMCIALLSTSHPRYSLILFSNRDEYLTRPTAPLEYWPPHPVSPVGTAPSQSHVLAGRDLQHIAHGTWLGITKYGRLACLTNFREESVADAAQVSTLGSRGEIAKAVLTSDPTRPVDKVVGEILEAGVQGVGGFSLIFGDLAPDGAKQKTQRLGVISNRSRDDGKGILWLEGGESGRALKKAIGLSNSHFGDRAWPKVVNGEQLLEELVTNSAVNGPDETRKHFVDRAFDVLNTDTLPPRVQGQDWEVYLRQLRTSIFIPAIGGEAKAAQDIASSNSMEKATAPEKAESAGAVYGTQKQSVILVGNTGDVTFVERTLFDGDARPLQQDRRFDFVIEPPQSPSS